MYMLTFRTYVKQIIQDAFINTWPYERVACESGLLLLGFSSNANYLLDVCWNRKSTTFSFLNYSSLLSGLSSFYGAPLCMWFVYVRAKETQMGEEKNRGPCSNH